jgi:tetratricopeptide (TPR) repeat protein
MKDTKLEAEADTLPAARAILQRQVPDGLFLAYEEIVESGEWKEVEVSAETDDAAIARAKEQVPAGATIDEPVIVLHGFNQSYTVKAFDEAGAERQAPDLPSDHRLLPGYRNSRDYQVRFTELKHQGWGGVFGVGRRPNVYVVTLKGSAVVRLKYRKKARIRAAVGTAFDKAMGLYRASQAGDRNKCREALVMFAGLGTQAPPNVQALIMRGQCAYDLYDKALMREALSGVQQASLLASTSALAQDVLGRLLYALEWAALDEVERYERQAENMRRVLELDPDYHNDLGKRDFPSDRASNARYREVLRDVETAAKKLRLEERLRSEVAATQTKDTTARPVFLNTQAATGHQAVKALFEGAIPALSPGSEARIQRAYLEVAPTWSSQRLYEGTEATVHELVLRNLVSLEAAAGFTRFDVATMFADGAHAAQINAVFEDLRRFVPIRVWRSSDKFFACGNSAFS